MRHLLWCIGWMTILLLKSDVNGAIETIYWIKIHLSFKGKCVGRRKLSFKQKVKNKCIEILGFLIAIIILFATYGIILLTLKIILKTLIT